MNEAAHTYKGLPDKEATASQAGSKHEECSVCGYAKAAVKIPAAGASDIPRTGDVSNIALWLMALLAASTALTSAALYSRKKKIK